MSKFKGIILKRIILSISLILCHFITVHDYFDQNIVVKVPSIDIWKIYLLFIVFLTINLISRLQCIWFKSNWSSWFQIKVLYFSEEFYDWVIFSLPVLPFLEFLWFSWHEVFFFLIFVVFIYGLIPLSHQKITLVPRSEYTTYPKLAFPIFNRWIIKNSYYWKVISYNIIHSFFQLWVI